MCVKELENTSLVCGSDRDLESSDNPTPAQLLSLTCCRNGQSFLIFWPKQTLIVTIVRTTRLTVFVLTVSIHLSKEVNLNVAYAVV